MALDKLVDSAQLDANLTSIANAIRAKTGSTATLAFPAGFTTEIAAIQTGGNYTTKTVTANEFDHLVTINNELRTLTHAAKPSTRTVGGYSNFNPTLSPSTALTYNGQYILTGTMEVIDNNYSIIEQYSVNTSFIWNTTNSIIIQNNSNAYFEKIALRKTNTTASNTSTTLGVYFQKNGTYGFRIYLYICEATSYDALSSVTISRNPYTANFMSNFIGHTSNFKMIEFPENLSAIGAGAFMNCTYLCSEGYTLTLPNTVTTIGERAFYNCSSLRMTSLPSNITSIDTYAFYNCQSLGLTSLPPLLTKISSYSFNGCNNMYLASLPNNVTKIEAYGFYNCSHLALTSLPSSLTTIENYAFSQCNNMVLTTLPSSLTYIGQYAFSYCIGLLNISCDGVITTFGQYAFNAGGSYTMHLQSARFPNLAITSNLGSVFGNTTATNACKELVTVDIGNAPGIAANAFANCYALQTLILRRTSVAALANVSAFLNTPLRGYNNLTGTVYVPSSLISSYRTATNWSTLYNAGTVNFVAIEGSPYEL